MQNHFEIRKVVYVGHDSAESYPLDDESITRVDAYGVYERQYFPEEKEYSTQAPPSRIYLVEEFTTLEAAEKFVLLNQE